MRVGDRPRSRRRTPPRPGFHQPHRPADATRAAPRRGTPRAAPAARAPARARAGLQARTDGDRPRRAGRTWRPPSPWLAGRRTTRLPGLPPSADERAAPRLPSCHSRSRPRPAPARGRAASPPFRPIPGSGLPPRCLGTGRATRTRTMPRPGARRHRRRPWRHEAAPPPSMRPSRRAMAPCTGNGAGRSRSSPLPWPGPPAPRTAAARRRAPRAEAARAAATPASPAAPPGWPPDRQGRTPFCSVGWSRPPRAAARGARRPRAATGRSRFASSPAVPPSLRPINVPAAPESQACRGAQPARARRRPRARLLANAWD